MTTVNVHDAKTHLCRLLERAHAGEEIVIAKSGRPYACLIPIEEAQPRMPGLLVGEVGKAFFEPLPKKEIEAWER